MGNGAMMIRCMCRGICGYPRVLHGGFTSAYLDESLGLLFYALRQHGCLPFIGPAFTAHLEVDYKQVCPPYTTVALLYKAGSLETRDMKTGLKKRSVAVSSMAVTDMLWTASMGRP